MKKDIKKFRGSMNSINIGKIMIAPCGMNCGICRANMRDKNKCKGCNGPDDKKPKYCIVCKIKNGQELKEASKKYCYACKNFPCAKLKQLDKRYRTKYSMSMIDNLKKIKEIGLDSFMFLENEKWVCEKCGDIICVHTWNCSKCGYHVKHNSIGVKGFHLQK